MARKKKSDSIIANLEDFISEDAMETTSVINENEDGTVDVEFIPLEDEMGLGSMEPTSGGHYDNLVDMIDEHVLAKLSNVVLQNVENDDSARSDWMKTIKLGFELLGIKIEEKSEPFEGACSAQHPLLMESAVKFQSKASNELLPANGPVRTKVLGDLTPEKEQQANRVKNHMNYQITELMTEFYTDTERMLLYLPLVGSGFKKTYYSSHYERPVSEFVPADLLIVPNAATDLYRADRYTHVLHKTYYDLEADYAAGLYKKPENNSIGGLSGSIKLNEVAEKASELMGMQASLSDTEATYTLYEQHITTHIEGLDEIEGSEDYEIASPYIVTVEADTGTVLGVRRNWKEGDAKRRKKVQFIHYTFVPGFNFYGYGFLHLLGNLQLTLTSALRSLVDAGQFATLQGGFKLKGVRINDDGRPIQPGQFKELETVVQDINKAIMPLPFKEPSQSLFMMLEFLDAKGQKFADSTEQVISDAANYGPVGTTMALLDASTKFFSAIHKRLHNSLKQELKAIAAINGETLEDDAVYNIENESMRVSRDDYSDIVDVVPVSDPNISSNAHRMAKAQTMFEFAMRVPHLVNMKEVLKHVLLNFDFVNLEKIMPQEDEAHPNDPLTDLQMASQGKPIKAFPGQEHKAHIAVKQAFLQDPNSGGSPFMQQIAVAIQANIREHQLLMFMEQVQAQAQLSGAPQEMAAQQVALMNQQELQQKLSDAEEATKDKAALLLAQAELMDSMTNAKKLEFDQAYKVGDLELKKERLDMDKVKEINRAEEKRLDMTNEMSKIVTTKALDAMVEGLKQKTSAPLKPTVRK